MQRKSVLCYYVIRCAYIPASKLFCCWSCSGEKKKKTNQYKKQKDNHLQSRSTLSFGQEDTISVSGDNFSLSSKNVLVKVQASVEIFLITVCMFLCHLGIAHYFWKYTLKKDSIIVFISLKLNFIFLFTFTDTPESAR